MKNRISIVIPFFNEDKEISKVFKDIVKFEKKSKIVNEYIFIDDCSTDKSLKLFNSFKKILSPNFKKKVRLFKNKKNLGWSKSLLKGYSLAKSQYILYIPGDGEAKLCEFLKKINFQYDLVIFQRKSMNTRPVMRRIISKIYKYILYYIFPIELSDLNGIILIKKIKIKELKLFSNSFFISAEIIIKSFIKKYKIDTSRKFKLSKKKIYKSTSLSFVQLFYVLIDLLKLISFRVKIIF
tara:strand:+ start:712 stop:1425 length:714 start_codon:yes stop_codon:yes gene_type:complete